MKSYFVLLLIFILPLCGCHKEINNPALTESVDSLSFWWNWSVFGQKGRGMTFEFYGTKGLSESYKLKFTYKITGRNILISLTDKVDNGKCINVETGFGSTCTPSGALYIPDSLISIGNFNLTLRTPEFETDCQFLVSSDSIELRIPPNHHLSSSISTVYPLPKNLLFGSIIYGIGTSRQQTQSFLDDLLTLGLTRTTLPDYPYYDLSVDKNGDILNNRFTNSNDTTLEFLYTMHNNFKDIFNLAVKHFNTENNISIYMYSSNGDQAFLNKLNGITIYYAK